MPFLIDTDNIVKIVGLKSIVSGSYVNDAAIKMALFEAEPQFLDTAGVAVTANGGTKTTLPLVGHGLTTNDYIRIFGSISYDCEIAVDAVPDVDSITIAKAFVAETFIGTEKVYKAVRRGVGTWPETASYVAASNGDYIGTLPDSLYLFPGEMYELVITEISGNDQVLVKLLDYAAFKGF